MDEVNLRLKLTDKEFEYLQEICNHAHLKNINELVRYAIGTFLQVMLHEDTGRGLAIIVNPNDLKRVKCDYMMVGIDEPFEVPPEVK